MVRQSVSAPPELVLDRHGKHTFKPGGEVRAQSRHHRCSASVRMASTSSAAARRIRRSRSVRSSGAHNIHPGDPLPDALTGLLTASAFTYTTRRGAAAVRAGRSHRRCRHSSRCLQRVLPGQLEDLRSPAAELRPALRDRIAHSRGANRTSAPVLSMRPELVPGSTLLINPQPPYSARQERLGAARGAGMARGPEDHCCAPAPASPPCCQSLPGQLRSPAARRSWCIRGLPRPRGSPSVSALTITPRPDCRRCIHPADRSYSRPAIRTTGARKHRNGCAALRAGSGGAFTRSPDHAAHMSPASRGNFQNGYIGTWTAGLEQEWRGATLNATYVGTAGIKLPVMDSPNGFPGATPPSRPTRSSILRAASPAAMVRLT